ncbi:HDOD domain-containing protein [Ruminococcaceae bacterium OttesenSCG-928-D13]|nr:HDOD domain-containing protein [Ruminococcaceae bacterium OttesenSCG-928-D13]
MPTSQKEGVPINSYFARQPILDDNQRLYAYELLFRPNPDKNESGQPLAFDGDRATMDVLEALTWGGINKITGGVPAFVNFTERLLLDEVATLYSKEFLVVEVLENIHITNAVLDAIRELKHKGYKIALDDYWFRKEDSALLSLCDIVKLEVDGSRKSYRNIVSVRQALVGTKCRLLAEKVETLQVFEQSRRLGCTLFQGYFFAKPNIMGQKRLSPLKLNQVRLIRELARDEMDFEAMASIVKQDIGLTYKTLRLVNSAYYGLQNEVKSINQALLLLGKNELRKWLTVSALNTLGEKKPSELIIMSMTRAKFCESAASLLGRKRDGEAFFLSGLFSLLDTLTDNSLEDNLAQMPVPALTKRALLEEKNIGRDTLDLIISMEAGDWDTTAGLCEKLRLTDSQVAEAYRAAIEWAQLFSEITH